MGMFTGGDPHNVRVPKNARRVIKRMLRVGVTPHRASVLHAQVNVIEHGVNRNDGRKGGVHPADSTSIAPGQRVRLGVETRALLVKLLESRNLRVQQALVRELRHQVMRRIRARVIRAQAAMRARNGARTAARWSWGRMRAGADFVAGRVQHIRSTRRRGFGRVTQAADRTRSRVDAVPVRLRSLPPAERAARRRARTPRTRASRS
jgi:hypothetical protein